MPYGLGIDIGSSFTTAAVRRADSANPDAEVVPLGARSAALPSVLYLSPAGEVLAGEPAQRRADGESDQVVRGFTRRVGDDVPLWVGGRAHQAHDLVAKLVSWVVDRVAEREGEPPDHVVVTHPAGWGPHKRTVLARALAEADLPDVQLATEPQAAATAYAARNDVAAGSTLAIYDLGGTTFDTAVLDSTDHGFDLRGAGHGLDRVGGENLDEAVFAHVRESLGDALDGLDPAAPETREALTRLRRETTEAKEALSTDTETTIPVTLPEQSTRVRLVRPEFEELITPVIGRTVDCLHGALESAGIGPAQLDAVLLIGGSARIPLVAQQVSTRVGPAVPGAPDPQTAIAAGAASIAGAALTVPGETTDDTDELPTVVGAGAAATDTENTTVPAPAGSTDNTENTENTEPAKPARSRPLRYLAAAGILAVGIGGAVLVPPISDTLGDGTSVTGGRQAAAAAAGPRREPVPSTEAEQTSEAPEPSPSPSPTSQVPAGIGGRSPVGLSANEQNNATGPASGTNRGERGSDQTGPGVQDGDDGRFDGGPDGNPAGGNSQGGSSQGASGSGEDGSVETGSGSEGGSGSETGSGDPGGSGSSPEGRSGDQTNPETGAGDTGTGTGDTDGSNTTSGDTTSGETTSGENTESSDTGA